MGNKRTLPSSARMISLRFSDPEMAAFASHVRHSLHSVANARHPYPNRRRSDPEKFLRIRTRVAESLTRLDPWFPGDLTTGILNEDHEAAILFEEFANDEPCPVLDLTTGTCDLYEHRPILCRTFGPPMRSEGDNGEVNLATCELCFIHATTEEITACELDPTVPAQEEASNEAFNTAHNRHGQTLIAYALRSPAPLP
jgi:Fe-S-cluster containining protein